MNTIFVRFISRKERDAMFSFLQSFDWNTIKHTEENPTTKLWMNGEDLGFPVSQGRKIIGIKTKEEPQWVWAVAAWLAQRSQYRIHNWGVVHHNDEEIPVVSSSKRLGNDVLVLDNEYKLLDWRDKDLPVGPDCTQQQHFIDQLNTVWNDYSATKK